MPKYHHANRPTQLTHRDAKRLLKLNKWVKTGDDCKCLKRLEARGGIEPPNKGFAVKVFNSK